MTTMPTIRDNRRPKKMDKESEAMHERELEHLIALKRTAGMSIHDEVKYWKDLYQKEKGKNAEYKREKEKALKKADRYRKAIECYKIELKEAWGKCSEMYINSQQSNASSDSGKASSPSSSSSLVSAVTIPSD